MEVGPLAHYIVGYAKARAEIMEQVDPTLKTLSLMLTALFRPSAEPLRVRWYALLLKGIRYRLEEVDLGVLVHSAFPANDGAIALGQAAIVGR